MQNSRPTHMDKKNVQTEFMVEIYSKSLVRAISKVLLMTFSLNASKRP